MKLYVYSIMKTSLSVGLKLLLMLSWAIVFMLGPTSSVEAQGKLTKNDILWGVARGGWCAPNRPCNESGVLESFYVNAPEQQGADLCRKRCILNKRCRAWIYLRKGDGCFSNSFCNLKSSVPNPVNNLCYASGYINPLVELEVCQRIGNINGQGPVTCIGQGGRNFGKAGRGFLNGDDVWILMRFRRLPLGEKTASVHYNKIMDGRWKSFSQNKREWNFTNSSPSWAHWFKAHYKTPGSWRVNVSARGSDLPRYILGSVEYTVGGPFD